MTARLDRLTRTATAWDRWEHLVAACRRGTVPSLRRDDIAQDFLGEALEGIGLRVFWG